MQLLSVERGTKHECSTEVHNVCLEINDSSEPEMIRWICHSCVWRLAPWSNTTKKTIVVERDNEVNKSNVWLNILCYAQMRKLLTHTHTHKHRGIEKFKQDPPNTLEEHITNNPTWPTVEPLGRKTWSLILIQRPLNK